MNRCKVNENDEFIPCDSMEDAMKDGAINWGKLFTESLVIGEDPEIILDFCPFCAEQV